MFWLFAGIVAATIGVMAAGAAKAVEVEERVLVTEPAQAALFYAAEEAAEGIGAIQEDITDEQIAINELQAEINRLAIEKTISETQFDLDQMERQMAERLAIGRARRGVSGLTAAGSPILVRQYLAEQYEKMMQFRERIGGIQVEQLESKEEILGAQASILGFQQQIRGIETQLKIAGIQFERIQFESFKTVRTATEQYQTISSLLDIGSTFLQFGYGMKRTQIPGYKAPFASPQIGYGGTW